MAVQQGCPTAVRTPACRQPRAHARASANARQPCCSVLTTHPKATAIDVSRAYPGRQGVGGLHEEQRGRPHTGRTEYLQGVRRVSVHQRANVHLDHLARQIGPGGVAVMKRIKQAFDPEGILNPGKIFADGQE